VVAVSEHPATGIQAAGSDGAPGRFEVEAERSGDWWAMRVPALPGVFSQARRLERAESMARDAIATFLGVPATAVEVSIRVRLPEPLGGQVDELLALRAALEADERRYAELSRRVATRLVSEAGLTVRDAGRVLHVTHQRVAQLVER
jgi:predicted RNase H-like HicB family nuclease